MGSKGKSLEEAASAKGQKSLPTCFATESDVSVEGNQNDISDGRQSPQGTSTSVVGIKAKKNIH